MKLMIWDSAGQERYKSLIPNYVRGASIIFLIYDICGNIIFYSLLLDKKSFNNLTDWIDFIKGIETAMIVICGNKLDNESER
jgi:GTPase SAR1 family protein